MTALENLVKGANKVSPREARFYRIGCAAAVVALVIFRRWLSSEFLLFRAIGIIFYGPKAPPGGPS